MNRIYRFNPLAGQEEYKGQDDAHAADGGRTGRVDAAHIINGIRVRLAS